MKRRPHLTITSFCEFSGINDELLPTVWVLLDVFQLRPHVVGFMNLASVMRAQRGTFVNGHERDDVVKYCKKFHTPESEIYTQLSIIKYAVIRRFFFWVTLLHAYTCIYMQVFVM